MNECMEKMRLLHFETDYYAFPVKFLGFEVFSSRSVYIEYLIMFVDRDFVFFYSSSFHSSLFPHRIRFRKTFSTFSVFIFCFFWFKNWLHLVYHSSCVFVSTKLKPIERMADVQVANVTITALEL